VYLPEVVAPAELPVEMNALKNQQHRWAKGYVQTGLKLLPTIWKAKIALKIKIEASLQLTNHFAYLMILILCLLMLPALLIRGELGWQKLYVLDIIVFMAATFSVGVFYMASEREVSDKWMKYVKYIPMLMSVGIGLSITNTRGIIEAILGKKTEFVRTPKYSIEHREKSWKTTKYLGRKNIITVLELILGFYFLVVVGVAWQYKMYASIPFLLLFPLGFFYASLLSIFQRKIGLAK
jgi:cellulose synthase/poly-beta-1,6-N-acetylglucosamine synthase-like glycosyltransferase